MKNIVQVAYSIFQAVLLTILFLFGQPYALNMPSLFQNYGNKRYTFSANIDALVSLEPKLLQNLPFFQSWGYHRKINKIFFKVKRKKDEGINSKQLFDNEGYLFDIWYLFCYSF